MWEDFLLYVAVGFAAQMVDGAIGMAYGVISTSVLLSLGIPPATASACVHAAETFTTAASGAAHWQFGNVDRKLLRAARRPGHDRRRHRRLRAHQPATATRSSPTSAPICCSSACSSSGRRCTKRARKAPSPARVAPLGFVGGLLDSIGGGGWGPIVTSTLIGQGTTPRYAIGSVNLAEFFVTLTISATFVVHHRPRAVADHPGLIIGGVIAAPFAAYATKHLPDKVLMIIVGCVVAILSLRTILNALALSDTALRTRHPITIRPPH